MTRNGRSALASDVFTMVQLLLNLEQAYRQSKSDSAAAQVLVLLVVAL